MSFLVWSLVGGTDIAKKSESLPQILIYRPVSKVGKDTQPEVGEPFERNLVGELEGDMLERV